MYMSCLPFRRVEFPGGVLWPAPMARSFSFTGLRVFVRSNICLCTASGIHPAPKARPFSKGLLSCHVRPFGVMRGGS